MLEDGRKGIEKKRMERLRETDKGGKRTGREGKTKYQRRMLKSNGMEGKGKIKRKKKERHR